MTKDPRNRISNYITHHIGDNPPVFYKIWLVHNEKAEETLALQHFEPQRVIKAGTTNPSEVVRISKAQIEAYSPRDPQKCAIAPHTMMPGEKYVTRYDVAQRFEEHWEELRTIQTPIINEIANFFHTDLQSLLNTPGKLARKLRAPCGTGKTHMTCEAIRKVATDLATFKAYIICPTRLIADQWRGNLYRLGIHAPILIKSDIQTKEGEQREDQTNHRFLIVTYSSCTAIRANPSWTYIFDEAHHTAGIIDSSNGITKRLVNDTTITGCRKLFLTFTPKNFQQDKLESNFLKQLNSMDNEDLYGTDIQFPDMRSLVESGLMPDYRLTLTYRDYEETLKAVINEIKDAKKIIVCLQSVEGHDKSIEATHEFLNNIKQNVFIAHGGMSDEQISESIDNFTNHSERSWLLTCLVLLEGADIPAADTVVLLAPWKTETRLIQLLLRPGRWFPKKPTFNIVVPTDENGLIDINLRVAGFDVTPKKIRHLRTQTIPQEDRPVTSNSHVWAVSYTDKNSVEGGLTPGKSDFDSAISTSQITAIQNGLDKAKVNDLVILRGPSHVAFATISAVRSTTAGTRNRTVMDVIFMRLPNGSGQGCILLSVKKYRESIIKLFDGREDRDWICNPRFTGANKYDAERHMLITHILHNNQ